MNFIYKYQTFSKWFYLIILGLTIPFYLLLYGASGHQFNPPIEDIIWIICVILSFVTAVIYFSRTDKDGLYFRFLKTLFIITLILSILGGLKSFLSILQFDFDDDISSVINGLSYLIPLTFTFSSIVVLIGLFIRKTE